jgi:acetyltransferase-like isoleucine patch superfamily enzyme
MKEEFKTLNFKDGKRLYNVQMEEISQYDLRRFASVGENVHVSRNVEIRRPNSVSIGSNVAIDSGFYLTTAAELGSYIHIGPYVTCIGGADALLRMENFTTIASGSRLIVKGDQHLGHGLVGPPGLIPQEFSDLKIGGQITMEKFSSVGTNAVIFPGVTISEGSVIGAGSIVTKDTEPWTIYLGGPARAIKKRDCEIMKKYGEILTRRSIQ